MTDETIDTGGVDPVEPDVTGAPPASPGATTGKPPAAVMGGKPGRKPAKKKKRPRGRGCWRGCATTLVAMALVVVAGGLAIWYELYRAEVDVSGGRPVQVEILKGEGTAAIAEKLAMAGVITNANMFRLQTRVEDADGRLRPGVYDLRTGMDYGTAIDALRAGPPIAYVTISIPEGFTLEQISQRVEAKLGIPAREFELAARTGASHFKYGFLGTNKTRSLEGYLFPKTYRVREGASSDEIIDMMLAQMEAELESVDLSYAASHRLTMHDIITVASMVEREARVPSDRPLIASVIYNRLRRGMRLEIDATVQYALGGTKKRLLWKDLTVESPYNTYLHDGLPPGPIASPGIASIRAAANPKQTGYYFYVRTRKDGTHSFAETEAEFLVLKAQAKRGLW